MPVRVDDYKDIETEKIPEPEKLLPKIPKCKYCGANLKEKGKFCTKCGKPVSRDIPKSMEIFKVEVSAKADVTPKAEDISQFPKCNNCGNPVKEKSKFCTNCGKPISKDLLETEQSAFKDYNYDDGYAKLKQFHKSARERVPDLAKFETFFERANKKYSGNLARVKGILVRAMTLHSRKERLRAQMKLS